MKNTELKLDYIESGRMSNGEMGEIYGGLVTTCTDRVTCPKDGKNSCGIYYSCADIGDPNKRNSCNNKLWLADFEDVAIC